MKREAILVRRDTRYEIRTTLHEKMSDDSKHRARIFLHRGQLAQAKAAYEQAVADDRLSTNQGALSDSLGNLGNVCALSGDLDQAEACYREVLTIQRTERNQQAIAHTLVNLGNLYVGAGTPEKARPYYLEALDLLTPLNDHRALGILYHNLGMEEARRSEWEAATSYFTRALDAHRIVGNEEGLALTYSQMGKACLDAGDLRPAEKCCNNASEHFIKLGNAPGEAAVLRLLADVYGRVADRVSAIRCLERVLFLATHYNLPELSRDLAALDQIRQSPP